MNIPAIKYLPILLSTMCVGCAQQYARIDKTIPAAIATTQTTATQAADAPWDKASIETRMILVDKDFLDDFGDPASLFVTGGQSNSQLASLTTATQPVKLGDEILDIFQLNLLLRATQADRRAFSVQCPRLILENGKRATLEANQTTYWNAFPRVDVRIERTADNGVRLVVEKVYQLPVHATAGTTTNDPDEGKLEIPDKLFPAEAVLSTKDALLLPAMHVTFADSKKHPQIALMIVIWVKPFNGDTTRPATQPGIRN